MFGFRDPRVQLADCRINAEGRSALVKKKKKKLIY